MRSGKEHLFLNNGAYDVAMDKKGLYYMRARYYNSRTLVEVYNLRKSGKFCESVQVKSEWNTGPGQSEVG